MNEKQLEIIVERNADKCLTPRCTRPAAPALNRGLCMMCHSSAKKMVESGTATWDGLASIGLALPGGNKDLFTEAVKEATTKGE